MNKLHYFKESPMFQFSLASKELFHSNFIYWLISNYKDEFSKLFSKLMSNEIVITKIKREEKIKI